LFVCLLIVVLGRGTFWHLPRFLQYIKYIILEFSHPPPTALLYPPPPHPIPGTVSKGIIFSFAYMCTYFLHCIHPPTTFPRHLPYPTSINPCTPPSQDLFSPPVLWFCRWKKRKDKKKNMAFFLFLIHVATQGFPCEIFMCICIITPIVLSCLIIYNLPYPLHYGCFSQFKISIFTFV
jgi:hypothetical protein